MMSENTRVTQKAGIGSDTTQIATQNNYYGMSGEDASKLAIKLFQENFPILQEEAKAVAEQRVDEFCSRIINELVEHGKNDFSEFSDPDMQYVLYKAQQEYARFGTDDLLEILSKILVERVRYNDNQYMKIILDEAIEVAKVLKPEHLNYMTLIFFCKQVVFKEVKSKDTLKEHLEYICSVLPVPSDIHLCCPFLNMMRLLELQLGYATQKLSEKYKIEKEIVEEIAPEEIQKIPGDYALSPVGIVIAIINAQNKTKYQFDYKKWIKNI